MKLSKSLAMSAKFHPGILPVICPGMFKLKPKSSLGSSRSSSSRSTRSRNSGSSSTLSDIDYRKWAFHVFMNDFKMSQECKRLVRKVVKKAINDKWAAMSEMEKEVYDCKAVQRRLEFDESCELYMKMFKETCAMDAEAAVTLNCD